MCGEPIVFAGSVAPRIRRLANCRRDVRVLLYRRGSFHLSRPIQFDHGHQHIEPLTPWVSEPNSIHRTDQRYMQALATGVVERLLSQRIMQDFDGPSVIVQQTWHLTGLMPAETAWRG